VRQKNRICFEPTIFLANEDKALAPPWSLLLRGGQQVATGQATSGPPPHADPDRLRAIVQTGAEKAGNKAVVFGMWVDDREILTMALGHSMTTVPATPDMHYRIGPDRGDLQLSTLLLMLVEQGRISWTIRSRAGFPISWRPTSVTGRMLVANTAGYIDYVRRKDFLDLQLVERRLAVLAKGVRATGAQRKKAIVAVARQLAVDLWRLHTGRCSPTTLEFK
jgi:CubicO group peptidase (beta-lactamase class C family)